MIKKTINRITLKPPGGRINALILPAFLFLNFALFAQSSPIRVACIGNSVTYGYGIKDRENNSYPAQLQQLLGQGRYQVKNFGHSGATLLKQGHNPYIKTQAFREALAYHADIAVVHLGLNDTDPRNWPNYGDAFMADYSWLIDTLRKANPSVKIYICRLTPIFNNHPRFRSGTRDWFWQIQDQIPLIAKANHTALIDLHTALYNRPDLFPDAIHPLEEGAAILAQTVYQKITGDFGGLRVPAVFASNMVLQRNQPIPFYGTANPNETISVAINKKILTATADENGLWKLFFPAMAAGGPFQVTIASKHRTILLEDVLVGEVWLCSGQSNMAFPLRNAINDSNEMQRAETNKGLRLLQMKPIAEPDNIAWDTAVLQKTNRLKYFSGTWQKCDSVQAKNFSAVAYYFAQKLQEQLKVPVGLIQIAVGGSTTESWIDRYTMEQDPILVNELYNWRKSDFFMPWVKERADTNVSNSKNPAQRHPYEPCYNFEAGISRFTGFPIKGVIWYQGESNAHNIELHEHLLPALVKSWRQKWGFNFPFYYVQLSSINRPSWPGFRFSQLQLLQKIPNSGMAVSSDVGNPTDVHPRHKKEVGQRLARLALYGAYHQKTMAPGGPIALLATQKNDQLFITFQQVGSGLKTSDGKPLRGFSVRDDKGIETPIKASLQKDKVVLTLDKSQKIISILYGWEPFTDANLANSENLPASTFKLEVK